MASIAPNTKEDCGDHPLPKIECFECYEPIPNEEEKWLSLVDSTLANLTSFCALDALDILITTR